MTAPRNFTPLLLGLLLTQGAGLLIAGCSQSAPESGNERESVIEIHTESLGADTAPEETASIEYISAEEESREEEALLRERSLIDRSLAAPGTLVATDEEGIYFINGRKVDITMPSVALTFDDGPMVEKGDHIMDVFEQYSSRCTFFLVGNMVPYFPDEVRRMGEEGFEIGNHSFDHPYFTSISTDEMRSQVERTNQEIEAASGVTPSLMRLPYGKYSDEILETVDMPVILWNVDSRDYATHDSASTIAEVVGQVSDGDIVLLHEIHSSTVTAVDTIVPALIDEGFQLVTVSELAALRGITPESGHVYFSF